MTYGIDPPDFEAEWGASNWFRSVFAYVQSRTKVVTKTADYALEADVYLVRVNATGGSRTVSLPPAASCTGRTVVMKKIDSSGNAATFDGFGSEEIDGATTKATTTQYAIIRIMSNGVGWDVL